MAERKLTEAEVEKRIERAHPASVIARLFCVNQSKRSRWDARREVWLAFNPIPMTFSAITDTVAGAMLGAFVATTAKSALGGSSDEMDAALKQPDWASIESMVRVLLTPGSRFLIAPIEEPVQVQPQADRQQGMRHVPLAPRGAGTRHHASRVMRA